ncbi:ubiquinone biosynthesis protein COQ9 [Nesidiocoris tenuis]|uniref:Ubiquinone biosynthesis protein n=1 Tax=Nesidiocoris tenuis TaxID=355587 RepID=A0ABN7AVE0_9HEMI|nr:ubiquinone biosynthesis protein COQ9 [Nesidiocoris tenuis]
MTANLTRTFARITFFFKPSSPRISCQRYISSGEDPRVQSPENEQEKTANPDKQRSADKQYEEGIKKQILETSLTYVSLHGWSKETISAGAESLGYPGVIHGMFPRGGVELVEYFYKTSNHTLAQRMAAETQDSEREKRSTKVFITKAIEERLRMIGPYIDHWPEALGLMSLPPNIPTSLANLLTLVDDICYYAGDKDVDLKWYGKRIALAGIYKTTELYLLQDSSADNVETWRFLERRMDEAQQMHRILLQTEQASQFAKEFTSATFITARNILGLNWNR